MGGVSDGSVAEGEGGAGIVKCTNWFVRIARGLARYAPVALISSVFVRSRNSNPAASVPRTNIGI